MRLWPLLTALLLLAAPALAGPRYQIRAANWSAADERDYGAFIAAIGASGCRSVDSCLHDATNPFRASDPPGRRFRADCADLPYALRFYFAWKRGLPFSYVAAVAPRGRGDDIRYTARGNQVAERLTVANGADAMAVLADLRDRISSATYRIHPELEEPESDFYSPALTPRAIRPGTVIYDPNGHLAIVWRIERDGRIRYIDAHPDNSLTRGFYDQRFVRASPGMGAGFKNWRPVRLVGAARQADGSLAGGHIVLARNAEIGDFALTQFFGSGPRPANDSDWKSGVFAMGGAPMDYYDYVRAALGGGALHFDPLTEMADMVASNCADLSYRADAVGVALAAGLQNRPQPERLPRNIYGTDGDWEIFSTPSRDARLKTAFKETRDQAMRFVALWRAHDPRLVYQGGDLVGDLTRIYRHAAAACTVRYVRSDGTPAEIGYEAARERLFRMSFDPYHCAEHRWGEDGPTCRDGVVKRRWYAAEQNLRNQLDRTYETRMDFSLGELESGVPGSGPAAPPQTDVLGWLAAGAPLGREKGR
jgi:hypothetical protein